MNDSAPPRPLPERPSMDQLRKQAKELRDAGQYPSLTAAQFEIAKRYGFVSWPKLKLGVETIQLQHAIDERNIARVGELLDESPALVASQFSDGRGPLHIAAQSNQPDIVALLVRRGASFDTKFGTSAHSALSWALTCHSIGAAKKLVELGNVPDLFCAAGLGDLDRVKEFWRDGRIQTSPSKTGSSRTTESGEPLLAPPLSDADQISDALYMSSRLGHLDVSRWLLDRGANPDWRGYSGATCLAWAEYSDEPALCSLLRERGASDDIADFTYGATPLAFGVIVLANWGFAPRLQARLSRDPALANARGRIGTALHAAVIEGQGKCAQVLIAFGADKTAKDSLGRTAADVALEHGYPELAASLR